MYKEVEKQKWKILSLTKKQNWPKQREVGGTGKKKAPAFLSTITAGH